MQAFNRLKFLEVATSQYHGGLPGRTFSKQYRVFVLGRIFSFIYIFVIALIAVIRFHFRSTKFTWNPKSYAFQKSARRKTGDIQIRGGLASQRGTYGWDKLYLRQLHINLYNLRRQAIHKALSCGKPASSIVAGSAVSTPSRHGSTSLHSECRNLSLAGSLPMCRRALSMC